MTTWSGVPPAERRVAQNPARARRRGMAGTERDGPEVDLMVCVSDLKPLCVLDRRKGDERGPLLGCPFCDC